jgi:iron complex outermembrane receptor protein
MENVFKTFVSYGDRIDDRFSILLSNQYTSTDGYANATNVQSSNPGAAITGWGATTDRTGKSRYAIGMKGANAYWHDNLSLKTQYDLASATKLHFNFMRAENEYSYSDPTTYLRDAAGQEVWKYGTVKEASFLSGPGGICSTPTTWASKRNWIRLNSKG